MQRTPTFRRTAALIVLLCGLTVLSGCGPAPEAPPPPAPPAPAQPTQQPLPAPAPLPDVSGWSVPAITQPGDLRMDAFPEHVVLVDFWASHVAQSKRELRALGELHQAFSDQPFTVLGVCLDAVPLDRARDRAQQWNSPYPVGLADAAAADAFGGLRVMPTRYLVDRQHRVRETYAGGVPLETIRADIEALLAE